MPRTVALSCRGVFLDWLTERRRRRLLAEPFPADWEAAIRRNMGAYALLDEDERKHLRDLVQVFAAEKHWEGAGGLEMTDEIRATISAQACLLILGLSHDLYRNVESIVVYPSTVVAPPPTPRVFEVVTSPVASPLPLLGQAFTRGPVILVWDAVRRGGRHPHSGHNVVYHEFAHKLDMLDGAADGVPPLADEATYRRWVEVCTEAYEDLRRRQQRGQSTLLDPYALESPAEFFAVATEVFFERPLRLERERSDLYGVLRDFYRQDPAARERLLRGR